MSLLTTNFYPIQATLDIFVYFVNILNILFFSEEILQAVRREEEIVSTAVDEVGNFCSRHEWIIEVQKFVRTWNNDVLASWRGRPTETIEVSVDVDKKHALKLTLSLIVLQGV